MAKEVYYSDVYVKVVHVSVVLVLYYYFLLYFCLKKKMKNEVVQVSVVHSVWGVGCRV